MEVGTNGELVGYNPLQDQELEKAGYAVGLGSRVMINNLTLPGSSGGWAHLPMLDIVKPPTAANTAQLIRKVRQRCRIEKFLVLKSSTVGMHVLGLELIDEGNFQVEEILRLTAAPPLKPEEPIVIASSF